ncbi:MAG: hypothetical protein HGB12_03790 [Bacteroidetes bacterium]|nr:hypothetical protein [Bacteroidota bacterium]
MCFSAGASFGASAVLCVVGVVAIKKTKTPKAVLFAVIPLFFSFQQFTEGFIWLTLTNPDYVFLQKIPLYIFLIFALVIWPTLVPLSIMLLEKNATRKKLLSILFGMGILLSVVMTDTLLFHHVSVNILSFHIHYIVNYPVDIPQSKNIFYFIPSVLPYFVSSVRKMKLFGFIIILSFIVSNIFFKENVVSVWCFFAAIISVIILAIIIGINKTPNPIEDSV